jgi:hypothetical protein
MPIIENGPRFPVNYESRLSRVHLRKRGVGLFLKTRVYAIPGRFQWAEELCVSIANNVV